MEKAEKSEHKIKLTRYEGRINILMKVTRQTRKFSGGVGGDDEKSV